MEFLISRTFLWLSMAQIRINLPSNEYSQTTNKRRGTLLKDVDENLLRSSGAKHANLWCKGELYPCNPLTGRHPNFASVSSLVVFACEGKSGLLGYCESMVQYSGQLAFHLNNSNLCVQRKNEEILNLKVEISNLKGELKGNQSTISHLQERNVQLEQDKTLMEIVIKQQEHETSNLKSEAKKFKKNICLLDSRLKRLKNTSLGLRERKKGRKPIQELKNLRCGAAKRRIYAVHQVLHTNKEKGIMRAKMGQIMKKLVTHDEIIALLLDPCNMSLRMRVIDMVIGEIYSKVNLDDVQGVCDTAVISQQGYRLLFRPFYDAIKSMGTKKIIIPRPYYLQKVKTRKNTSISEILGSMYSIESGIPTKPSKSLKRNKANDEHDIIGLSANNNAWFDLEKVLMFMVVYYNLHESDVDGKLEICLKLDEMELSHKTKFERVSLTLMNKALVPWVQVNGRTGSLEQR